jgi:2'-5' RNA ligase
MANDIPEAKLEAMARLFLAVWPPNHVREMLGELPYEVQRGVRFVSRESLHATLRFLGDANPNEVGEALRSAPLPATTATVGPAIDMLGTHSVIAPVEGLDKLAAAVVDATNGLGTLTPRPTFNGHITVARVRRGATVRKMVGMGCASSFEVGEVALVESRLHPTGSTYATLNRWPVLCSPK